jgi:predicted nucleic acid-binding protein
VVILYLDTSALVKLYVDEDDTSLVRDAVSDAKIVGTSEIAYVELRSAMARRHREGAIERAAYRRVLRDVEADWQQLLLIAVNNQLVHDAGGIAERYGLRAYDAVHLASSLVLQTRAKETVTFACWDKALQSSAAAAKLQILRVSRL